MRAMRYGEFGGPEKLRIEQVSQPRHRLAQCATAGVPMADASMSGSEVNAEAARALDQLRAGTDLDRVLEELSVRITNKMLHPLIVALRSQSAG